MTTKHGVFALSMIVAAGASMAAGYQAPGAEVRREWTPGEITALVGAIGVVLTVIFAGIVNVLGALKKEVTKLVSTAAVIEGHVNSATTKSDTIITAQETQLEMQRITISKLEAAAGLVAQAQALATAHAAAPPPVPPAPPAPAPAAGPLAAMAEAAQTIVKASPQLDYMQATGESTNTIVKEIDQKP